MCGIAGGLGSIDSETATRMADRLLHRGPDDRGVYAEPGVALAVTRLSIIDLKGGHQPISNEDGSIWAVQNGEIYNSLELRSALTERGHLFRTRSDTEVLAHAYEEWGTIFVERLRGMFALAIWDRREKRLVLARDRLGIKPLYLTENSHDLRFASEIRALRAASKHSFTVGAQGVADYLTLQGIPAPETIFEEVTALSPAEVRLYTISGEGVVQQLHTRRYWSAQKAVVDRNIHFSNDAEAEEAYRAKLEETIRLHLLSDVPVGIFLSGGIDSSLLVPFAAEAAAGPMKTLTIGWEGSGSTTDERAAAGAVAQAFGTQHEEILLSPERMAFEFTDFIHAMDQPTADGWNSYLVSQAASRNLKVAFSGIGGDELFLGYDYVRSLDRFEMMCHFLNGMGEPIARRLLRGIDRFRGGRPLADIFGLPLEERLECVGASLFSSRDKRALLRSDFFSSCRPASHWIAQQLSGHDLLTDLSLYGLNVYLRAPILPDIDVMSMSHGLEVRVPYLDHEFVEFALSLKNRLKFDRGRGKILPRRLARKLLPKAVLGRKRGFTLPIGDWLNGPLRPFLKEMLSEDTIRRRGWFSPTEIKRLLLRFETGQESYVRVWALAVLEGWLQRLERESTAAILSPE